MKYRFLGYSVKGFHNLQHGKIYRLVVVTGLFNRKPKIIIPFYCPYGSWKAFYKNWRPLTMSIVRLEKYEKRTSS